MVRSGIVADLSPLDRSSGRAAALTHRRRETVRPTLEAPSRRRWAPSPVAAITALSAAPVIPARLADDLSDPRLEAEESDAVGIVGEGVPGVAAGVDDGLEVREAAQAEEALVQPESDALHRVELRRTGRRRDERDRSEGP